MSYLLQKISSLPLFLLQSSLSCDADDVDVQMRNFLAEERRETLKELKTV